MVTNISYKETGATTFDGVAVNADAPPTHKQSSNIMTDLRTDLQKARDKRANRVCELFNQLQTEGAVGSTTAKIDYIASVVTQEGDYISSMGVRIILKRENLI